MISSLSLAVSSLVIAFQLVLHPLIFFDIVDAGIRWMMYLVSLKLEFSCSNILTIVKNGNGEKSIGFFPQSLLPPFGFTAHLSSNRLSSILIDVPYSCKFMPLPSLTHSVVSYPKLLKSLTWTSSYIPQTPQRKIVQCPSGSQRSF
jgi:hypothetical protein